MNERYADIIIDISHEKVDRPFQYKIPERLLSRVEVGSCVEVPFGRGNTLRSGYVIGIGNTTDYDPSKIKEICGIKTDNLPAEDIYIKLAAWMKNTYGSTMIAALGTVMPSNKKQQQLKHKYVTLRQDKRQVQELFYECWKKKQVAKARLLETLLSEEENVRIPYSFITVKLGVSAATIRSMAEKGIISVTEEEYYRNPVKLTAENLEKDKKILSKQQANIVNTVISDYDNGSRYTSLIHGITGSGKTEVYISLISEMIKRGKQAIVLIPEIALTYQTLMRFYRHFGDRVSVMNSTLSAGEKYDQFQRARNGEIDIVIGPRSALFTPFPDLGIIIIDEEHEGTYKSEKVPRYHARETAIELSKLVPGGAMVVLGSATPSLESYYKAQNGTYKLFEMTKRLTGGKLSDVEVVDLRDELKSGNRSIFSRALQGYMADRLSKGQQAMLFINRRGLAGFVSCRACGHVFKCPHCDVALSEHRGGKLVCHYCGYEEPITRICPECGSKYVSAFKAGTEQIENEVIKFFPEARILRMDADTTRKKGSYDAILSAFSNGEADILVGTQMIVKGHDFPNCTLVGVLAADMSLYASDYRAGERTFQLLTQAAGRAGRGELPGNVVIQTYQPENYSIIAASKQDYKAFYEEEIAYRELLMYPPAAHMMAIQILSDNEEKGTAFANRLRAYIETPPTAGTVFIGPAPASIYRISDVFRMVIYVKHLNNDVLIDIKNRAEKYVEILSNGNNKDSVSGISISFDFDPMNGF